MSPRSRFLVIFVLTVFVVSAAIGYMIGRARYWHEHGWTGVMYLSGDVQAASHDDGAGPLPGHSHHVRQPADGKLLYRDEI
jgi:hypothetical protein